MAHVRVDSLTMVAAIRAVHPGSRKQSHSALFRGLQGFPRESKYPVVKDSGPKNHSGYGIWNQSPSILGTWTPWVPVRPAFRKLLKQEPGA